MYGNPVLGPDEKYISLDKDGVPRDPKGRAYYLDEERQLMYGPNGKPLLKGPDSHPVSTDGRPILVDEFGQPILGDDGLPTILGRNSNKYVCVYIQIFII